ncbi:MAG: hypothetical protein RIQ33_263 [Bacteroidota bacterium]|jgi:hypothetical protein
MDDDATKRVAPIPNGFSNILKQNDKKIYFICPKIWLAG